ncbi:MAG: M20/M25/M40 family metallo-hydrolase, partial [Treponema sp.]|nr:M20/M25/M40 family metallo-hydrolase [Treponema sp.]
EQFNERLKNTFFALLEADSPFGHERAAAKIITAFLDRCGILWEDDGSAARTGSDTGNIVHAGPGSARLSFCAHMDTIRIFEKKPAVAEGTVIKAAGGGVLGIDDKSGAALLLELMALLHERGGIPPDIHFLFTTCEESGFRGAWALDPRHFTDAYNFVVDSGGVPLARVVNSGVGQASFSIGITGVMAHASSRGGKNAALFAAECIAAVRPGPAGASSFIHVASLECPGSPNTIPDGALIGGQLLYDDEAEAEALLEETRAAVCALADRAGFTVVFSANRDCAPWTRPENDPLLEYARLAAAKVGLPFHTGRTGSGSDAQVIARRGGRVIKISTGMLAPHSAEERIDFRDMKKALRFLWALAGREPSELDD